MKENNDIELPMQKVMAASKSPNNLIIFSKPKVGKTSLLAELPNALMEKRLLMLIILISF